MKCSTVWRRKFKPPLDDAYQLSDAGLAKTSFPGTAYRHKGNNVKIGVGYTFGRFSDHLTGPSRDNKGLSINPIAKV